MSELLDFRTANICSEALSFFIGGGLIAAVARQKNRIPRNGFFITGMLMSEMGTATSLFRVLAVDTYDNAYMRAAISYILPAFFFFSSLVVLSQYFPGMLKGKKNKWPDAVWLAGAISFPAAALLLRIVVPQIHLIGTGFTIMYFLIYTHYQSLIEMELLKKRLELSESRMTLLTRQISPRFFFNSLKSLQELCHIDPERAEKAIGDYSDFMRLTIEALTRGEMLPFPKVLYALQEYLQNEVLKSGERIKIEYDIGATDFMIPPFLVEPVVVGAMRRIKNAPNRVGKITIGTEENDLRYIIRVTDNGLEQTAGRSGAEDQDEIEIDRARARLSVMCKGEMIITRTADGTETAIIIPKEKTKIRD